MIKAAWTGTTVSVYLEPANTRKRLPAGYAIIRNADGADWGSSRWDDMDAAIASAQAIDARIAAKAEAVVVTEAETATETVAAAAVTQALATAAHVAYIQKLLRQGRSSEGGFFNGPTTLAGIRSLTVTEASTYIDSLTGQY